MCILYHFQLISNFYRLSGGQATGTAQCVRSACLKLRWGLLSSAGRSMYVGYTVLCHQLQGGWSVGRTFIHLQAGTRELCILHVWSHSKQTNIRRGNTTITQDIKRDTRRLTLQVGLLSYGLSDLQMHCPMEVAHHTTITPPSHHYHTTSTPSEAVIA